MLCFAIYFKCFVVLCNEWVLKNIYIGSSISSSFLYCHGCQFRNFKIPL